MNLTEAIQSVDMDEIIDRMNAYAISLLKSVRMKDFNGREPIDFVGDVIMKVIEGKRDWNKAQCSFTEFLFGCLRSEISNFFKTQRFIHNDELPDIPSDDQSKNFEDKKNQVSELLRLEDATDEELIIFDFWMDGVTKPIEIAKDLGVDVKEIYNITKRLERRLQKVQSKALKII